MMSNRPPTAEHLTPEYHVRVLRQQQPPRHWTWAIYRQGERETTRVSAAGFRSADEAWQAGQAEFARLGFRSDPLL